MRLIVTSFALFASLGAALAQTGSITPAPAAPAPGVAAPAKSGPDAPGKAPRSSKAVVDENKAECMRLWDAGTHMSKREWSSTCDRIQTRLDNLKVEDLDLMGTGMRKKSGGGKQGSVKSPGRTN